MAKCEICGQEMLQAHSCTVNKVHIGGKVYNRIPVGGDGDWGKDAGDDHVCGDCGAHQGGFHHWGCDVERCPACGMQLISCDCENVFAETEDAHAQ